MEFRLIYKGELKANAKPPHKHQIRRALHPQLKELWELPPLSDHVYYLNPKREAPNSPALVTELPPFRFASLVHSQINVVAEIAAIIMKPGGPGAVVRQGGDLDNQLKTLLDALRQPHHVAELPTRAAPDATEDPFFCLLEDDQLITRVDLSAYRWLAPSNPSHVRVDVLVRVRPKFVTRDNIFLG